MKYLLNIAIFAFVAWGIWKAANRWFDFLGGNRDQKAEPPPVPPQSKPQPRVVEDTHPCPVCGAFVAAGAGKCERRDCPQT